MIWVYASCNLRFFNSSMQTYFEMLTLVDTCHFFFVLVNGVRTHENDTFHKYNCTAWIMHLTILCHDYPSRSEQFHSTITWLPILACFHHLPLHHPSLYLPINCLVIIPPITAWVIHDRFIGRKISGFNKNCTCFRLDIPNLGWRVLQRVIVYGMAKGEGYERVKIIAKSYMVWQRVKRMARGWYF